MYYLSCIMYNTILIAWQRWNIKSAITNEYLQITCFLSAATADLNLKRFIEDKSDENIFLCANNGVGKGLCRITSTLDWLRLMQMSQLSIASHTLYVEYLVYVLTLYIWARLSADIIFTSIYIMYTCKNREWMHKAIYNLGVRIK